VPPSRGWTERIFVKGSTHENCKANACVRLCLNFQNQTNTKYLFFVTLTQYLFFCVASIPQQRVIINDPHERDSVIYSCSPSPAAPPFPTARAFTTSNYVLYVVRALQILHAKMSGRGQRTSLRSSPVCRGLDKHAGRNRKVATPSREPDGRYLAGRKPSHAGWNM